MAKRIVLDIADEVADKLEANKAKRFIKTSPQYITILILEDNEKLNDEA